MKDQIVDLEKQGNVFDLKKRKRYSWLILKIIIFGNGIFLAVVFGYIFLQIILRIMGFKIPNFP